MHGVTLQQDLALIRNNRTAKNLDERTLAGAVVAHHRQHFASLEFKICSIERGDLAVPLRDTASLQYYRSFRRQSYFRNGLYRHRCFPLEILSRATSLMTRM